MTDGLFHIRQEFVIATETIHSWKTLAKCRVGPWTGDNAEDRIDSETKAQWLCHYVSHYVDLNSAIPITAVKTIKKWGKMSGHYNSRSSLKFPLQPSSNVLCETSTLICPAVSEEVHLPNSAAFIFWRRPLRRRLTTLVGLRQYYSKCLGARRGEQANYGSTLCKGDSRFPL